MNTLGISALVVMAVVSLLWTALLIPVLLEMRRAAWRLQEFIRSLEMELRPLMQEARQVIKSVEHTAQGVGEGVTHLRGAFSALEDAGENLRATTGVIRAVFGTRLIPAATLMAGLRAGLKMLWKRYPRRRETT
jgi:type II secretory pathway pseudopilin PulG